MSRKDGKLPRKAQRIKEKILDPDQHTNLKFGDVKWFLERIGYAFEKTKNGYRIHHPDLRGRGPDSGPLTFDRVHPGRNGGYEVCHKFLKYVKKQLLMLEELGVC